MQIVQTAVLYPSSCLLTKSTEGPFLDLGRDTDFGERIYIAVRHVDELTRFVGGLTSTEAAELAQRVNELEERLAHTEAVEAELENLKASVAVTLQHGPTYGPSGKAQIRKNRPKATTAKKES